MDRDPGDVCIGPRRLGARKDICDRVAHGAFAAEVEPHAADLGLVHDVGRQDFRHHGRAFRQQRCRNGGGFLGIAREQRGCDRNGIGRAAAP